jgi:hypothetical protein
MHVPSTLTPSVDTLRPLPLLLCVNTSSVLQVIVGNAAWRFGSYLSYCRSGAELDEMPLYMFDKVRGVRVLAVYSFAISQVLSACMGD